MSDERPEPSDLPEQADDAAARAQAADGESPSGARQGDPGQAAGTEAREALARLGEKARSIVEELTRSARQREEAAKARDASQSSSARSAGFGHGGSSPATDARDRASMLDAAMPELNRRLAELRACIGEVSDVLEATVERLETIEDQLGTADLSVERTISQGISRCERLLAGIEHRVSRVHPAAEARAGAAADGGHAAAADARAHAIEARTVVVVARPSQLRARLCIALERHGLFALAALDAMGARRAIDRAGSAAAALLCFTGSPDDRLLAMEQWKSAEQGGLLPRAAVWITAEDAPAVERDAAVCELPVLLESHGEAALAAGLLALGKPRDQPAGHEDRT